LTVDELNIPGVLLITPKRVSDSRGWFSETYSQKAFKDRGLEPNFVQDNHSLSVKAGTLRGFHLQTPPHAQAKLVRCVRGRILDVAVDLRVDSPTYAGYAFAELSPHDGGQLFIPVGFAHAFLTLEPETEVLYKATDIYAPQCEAGIRWDDPTIAFPWQIRQGPFLSQKDEKLPLLEENRLVVYEKQK
jgi:dTDP-4-dehydrorhamnose 3,5-epimerase